MKRQRSLILLTTGLCLLGTNALADKLPNFTGAYLGVAVGYGQQRVEVTDLNPAAPASGQTFKDSEGSVTFGGYTGYNWQYCAFLLFGIETDFNFLNSSPTARDIEVFPVGTDVTTLESNMDWFGTLRGRVGYVVNDFLLLYGTGGLAYGKVDHKFNEGCVSCQAGVVFGPIGISHSATKVGWTAGGGAEYIAIPHWLVRAEALYVDLGSSTYDDTLFPPGGGSARVIARWDDQFWIARLGLAYEFNAP